MRVFMVAGVAAMVLALGAGCADEGGATDAAASAAGTSAAASPSAAGGDPACDSIKALQVQYFDKIIAGLQKAVQASQGGDSAGGVAALADAKKLAAEWAGKLEPLAAQVADAELKPAVTRFVGQLKQYSTDEAGTIAQIQTAGPAFTSVLLKVCP
ncbi:hypothetical protein ACFO1B_48925 [Dactylosporangium siamense]|uniref:Lipoprotein n=1 Tax=Dactylosporangium siamense TaxID=685454 RepID=A0A919PWL9_9ACTN|nr:hypothetical protein [Dactylosporangium siamense]GIG52140.1 hypothetical protein Dsi01nite_101810 [Dactylosporangium siamense]